MHKLKRLIEAANRKNEDRLENKYVKKQTAHVELVNKYAAKLNLNFPEHDADKFGDLLSGYKFSSKDNRTIEEQKLYDEATGIHVNQNSHHPEYWAKNTEKVDKEHYTRLNPVGCPAYKMTRIALIEMCCDWCASSEEANNTPFEWAMLQIKTNYRFTSSQTNFIYDILAKLWNNS